MDEKIDKAMETVLSKIRPGGTNTHDQDLKYTQAVLNLAHAKTVLEANKPKTKGGGA